MSDLRGTIFAIVAQRMIDLVDFLLEFYGGVLPQKCRCDQGVNRLTISCAPEVVRCGRG
ncbi:MAG: hypothetical protein KJZ83_20950 [Burkholderiaceae bacterium]|nr:hypothetical protein [Burkholderiaceae bacterium]